MRNTGLYFTCLIGGLPEETFDVVEFTLEEGLSSLFTLELVLVSKQPDLDAEEQLLQQASLTVWVDEIEQRTINGVVASMMQGDTGFERTYYYITVRPQMWTMTLDQDSRIYHQSSVPDILAEIVSNYGLQAQSRFDNPHQPREYTTMKRESSYAFFSRLAAEEGITFWFNDQGLYYSDTHLSMKADVNLEYNPHSKRPLNTPVSGDVINKLSYGAFMRPGETVHKDYNYSNPSFALQHDNTGGKSDWHSYSVFESYGRFQKGEEGDPFTKYRLERLRSDSQMGFAHSNCIKVSPGHIFILEKHPSQAMNDRWQIVTVRHHGIQPTAVEEENDGKGTYLTNELTFIPGRNDWRPPFRYKPLADGDEVATVVGPAGEEIYVNEDGAVRVHFHWNRYDEADDKASCWVRVAQGWNGDGFGFLATPRIGQEVIISYLNGDVDRPIITGCNYNGLNRPPLDLPSEKTKTTFKTKTHKGEGFNELRFEDEAGKEEFYIHAQKDMNTDVLNDRSTTVGNDHTESVSGNQSIDVQKDQTQSVHGDQTETIDGDQTQTTHGSQTETIDGNQVLTVKQNQAETVLIAKAETIGAAKALTIGAAYQVSVGAMMNTSVGLSQSSQVGVSKSMLIGKNYTQNVGSNKVTVVTKNNSVKTGQHIKFQAGDSFTIVCGKSKLVMDKTGKITLNGKDLTVDTTAKQTFKAKGDIKLKAKKIHEN